MKKNLLFITTLSLFISTVFAQENFSGVSGNMVSGDFDNDGYTDDIAAFNTLSGTLQLNLWVGQNNEFVQTDVSFETVTDILSPTTMQSKIVSGDFDNDGFIDDLAAIYEIGFNKTHITVWLNKKGEFISSHWWYGGDFDANQTLQTLVCADFDNDGYRDDIAAFYNYEQKSAKAFVWKSNGKQFSWPGTWWFGGDFDASRIQGTIVAGDFDHDGFVDDITGLYDYSDGFCKAFVWTSEKNKFNWPYTWFAQDHMNIGKARGNVVSGDFDANGFLDDMAALYPETDESSKIWVFTRNNKGFAIPENWWYGNAEAINANSRLVTVDLNNNLQLDQFAGLLLEAGDATLCTWTATNHSFQLPEDGWKGTTLSVTDCDKNGGCINNNMANTLKVYPNPTIGPISLQVPDCNDAQVTISVYNILGSEVYTRQSKPGQEVTMDEMGLKTGTYLLEVTGNNLQVRQNFIVQ